MFHRRLDAEWLKVASLSAGEATAMNPWVEQITTSWKREG
jgi:hypothetical protein